MTPQLTVVISTRNRREVLLETLELLRSLEAAAPWEIVVVANACTDDTAQAVGDLSTGYPIPLRCETEPRPGLSHGRNCGLNAARAPLVTFIDDDVNCLPGWVDSYVRAFGESDIVAAGGPIIPVFSGRVPGWITENRHRSEIMGPLGHYDLGNEPIEVGREGQPQTPFGGNCCLRRELTLRVGAFRPDLGWGSGAPGEETELFQRLLPHGRIVYLPGSGVEHRIREEILTRKYFVHYHSGQGRSHVRVSTPNGRLRHLRRALRESGRVATKYLRTQLRRDRGPRALASYARSRGRLLEHISAARRPPES